MQEAYEDFVTGLIATTVFASGPARNVERSSVVAANVNVGNRPEIGRSALPLDAGFIIEASISTQLRPE